MAKSKKSAKKIAGRVAPPTVRVYTLDVELLDGPMITEKFAKENPVVSRTIEIRGDQTLQDLHDVIFDAFGRDDEHLYEFQFGGKKPMDRNCTRYVHPFQMEDGWDDDDVAGSADETTLDALGLKKRGRFFYWFDFGDDWMHKITVTAVGEKEPEGKYPRVTKQVGASPPQYPNWDEEQ